MLMTHLDNKERNEVAGEVSFDDENVVNNEEHSEKKNNLPTKQRKRKTEVTGLKMDNWKGPKNRRRRS